MNNSKMVIDLIMKLADKKHISMSELAKRVGVAKSSLSRYKNGERDFPINDVGKYAKVLNTSIEYLLGLDSKESLDYEYPYMPTTISAGLPNDVDAVTDSTRISIPDTLMGNLAGCSDIYFTRTNGDSMNKVIPHGSLIAIRPISLDNLKDGDIVVYKYDNEYAVKRFYDHGDTIVFRPDSSNMIFTDQIVQKNGDIELIIKGKVVLWIVEAE